MNLTPLDLHIDSGINPHYSAPCPGCGTEWDIARNAVVGIATKDGPRLCSECINAVAPDLADVLDVVSELEYVIAESENPYVLAICSRALLKVAVQTLLFDVDWQASSAARALHIVGGESA